MKRFLPLIITLLLSQALHAYDLIHPVGGRAAAMGGSCVASQGLWSIQNNPAGLAGLERMSLGLYYENQWMLPETAYKCGAFAIPVNFGTLGVSFNQYGYSKFNENKIGLAYARGFGKHLQIGLQLDYFLLKVANEYGNRSTLTFELGIQSQITDKLTLGAYVFNPARFAIRETLNQEPLPVVFRLGASYHFTKDFLAQLEVEEYDAFSGLIMRGGLEYEAIRDLYIRAGAQIGADRTMQQGMLTFGLGYKVSFAEINVGAQLHQMLGNTINIGMIFNIGK